MSEHHRGAWGARDDAVWWPGAITADQQSIQTHHQHLLNQHHQQQQQIAQQQHQQQQQQQQQQAQQQQAQAQHEAAVRSTASAAQTQQLFSYKMASSFQNPATTGSLSNVSSTSPVGSRGYDYRLGGGMVNPSGNASLQSGNQWWYPSAMDNSLQNSLQNSMQNSLQNMQNSMSMSNLQNSMQQQQSIQPVHTPPPTSQSQQNHHQQVQQQQAQQQAHHQVQQHLQSIQQQQISVQTPRGRMPRGKGDSRPRGRMTAYAFFVQTCREEHKKKHPEENVVFAEFSKKCAERWKTMLDKEKKRFHEMAEKDKMRYDTEMKSYVPKSGEKTRGKKRKQVKDPNAPKRSLSAFFWFCNDERSKVKAANPEYGVGDIAKELGRRWSDVDAEVKSKYEAMADKDKARYEKEMTAYKKKSKPNAALPPAVPEPEEDEDDDEDADDDEDD